jgi:hypothetical protein
MDASRDPVRVGVADLREGGAEGLFGVPSLDTMFPIERELRGDREVEFKIPDLCSDLESPYTGKEACDRINAESKRGLPARESEKDTKRQARRWRPTWRSAGVRVATDDERMESDPPPRA